MCKSYPSLAIVWIGLAVLAAPARGAAPKPDAATVEFFEKKIRPVLTTACVSCHNGRKTRGGLTLENRAALLRGGDTGPAIVPGHPEKSLLIEAIAYKDHLRMPPRGKLPAEQIADLTAWVKLGAPWPGGESTARVDKTADPAKQLEHWSLQPVRRPRPPAVNDRLWAHTPFVGFLLAWLEAAGIRPAGVADRRTLLRRLTFDLTGLPPTPRELADFLADRRPDAYERAVDRLLASPAHGERWGRHWLDLMRYAETSGHEFDFDIPHADGYRDYIIRALNDDVPYDQFVREHIAGDLLPQPRRHPAERTNESILGTGFWFLGESKHSPVDLRVDGGERRDNMLDVFGKTFLGLTVGCARCHDHKFDPLSTKEYYALVGYLQSARMQRAFLDPPERIAEPARRLRALRAEAARLAIEHTAAALQTRLTGLAERRAAVAAGRAVDDPLRVLRTLGDPAAFDAKRRDLSAQLAVREGQARQATPLETFARGDYRDWFVTGDAFGDRPAGPDDVEVQPDRPLPVRRIFRGAHSGLASGRLQGALRSRTFTLEKKYLLYRVRGHGARVNLIIDGFQQIRDPIYGGLQFAVHADEPRWHVQNVSMWRGLQAYVELLDDGDGAVELEQIVCSDQPAPPVEAPNRLIVALVEAARSADEAAGGIERLLLETVTLWRQGKLAGRDDLRDRLALLDAVLAADLPTGGKEVPAPARLGELVRAAAALEATLPAPRRGLALADGTGVNERVHIRGNPKTLGDEAPRRLPAVVAGDRQALPPNGSGRLEMAQRLTSSGNPLLARVIVNRLWHHHFGQGIVATTDDFGHQGDRPTHPELLDWLAAELVDTGWSLKHIHRLLLTSAAYRMASRSDPAAEASDPRNLLLHRMPIRRLEAEAIRDALLASSGRLDRRMFGKGPLPHLSEFMIGRGRPGASGPLDGDGRRSLYLSVRRNFLSPFFLAFDFPTPFSAIGRRSVSNVPAQALALLNNPFVTGEARRWADQLLADPALTDEGRVATLFETAFGRPPDERERADALAFVAEQGREHGRVDARAWADLAHVLFNAKEFVFVH
ncbi:MAG: PSD1 and planctomycete cytochrome C domain-containing protein [Gemmataceae bacterium]